MQQSAFFILGLEQKKYKSQSMLTNVPCFTNVHCQKKSLCNKPLNYLLFSQRLSNNLQPKSVVDKVDSEEIILGNCIIIHIAFNVLD